MEVNFSYNLPLFNKADNESDLGSVSKLFSFSIPLYIFSSCLSFRFFFSGCQWEMPRGAEIDIPSGANIWGELCVAHGGGNVSSGSRRREILMRTFSAETYTSRSCEVSQMLASMHFVCSVSPLFCSRRIYGSCFCEGNWIRVPRKMNKVSRARKLRFYNSKILKCHEKFGKRNRIICIIEVFF